MLFRSMAALRPHHQAEIPEARRTDVLVYSSGLGHECLRHGQPYRRLSEMRANTSLSALRRNLGAGSFEGHLNWIGRHTLYRKLQD